MGGARRALRGDPRHPPARAVRLRPRTRGAVDGRRRGAVSGLLQEPRHRRDAGPAAGAGRAVGAGASGPRRCSRASRSTSRRTLGAARRAADAGRRVADRRRRGRRQAGARGAGADGHVRREGPLGRMAGPHRQADPQRGQHRHRRIGPRAGDGVRGVAPLLRARADVQVRVERGCDRLRRGHARPRPRRDAGDRLLEDVHDPGDDDQRPLRARVAARRAGRRGGDRQALRRRLHERRRA